MTNDDTRGRLIAAVRAGERVLVTFQANGVACIASGKPICVNRTHVVLAHRSSETAVAISAIDDVTAESAPPKADASEAP